MDGKIRVLMSVGSLGIGGNEQFAMNVFRNIDKDKFKMDFVVFDRERLNYYQEIIESGSQVFFCESKKKNKFLSVIDSAHKVSEVLKNGKYDIIHCNSCSFFGILQSAVPGKKSKGTKVIAHAHNPGTPKNNLIDGMLRVILKSFTCAVIDYGFSCSDIASEHKYTDRFIKSDRHYIIHNAIEVQKFIYSEDTRISIRREFCIPDDAMVIGHVGRLEYQKNHNFLIDIFLKIQNINENSRLLLVGDGTLRKALEKKSEKLGIKDKVVFTGFQNNVERFYNAMDCVVMPSYYEGFPFTVVEAQINGLKILLSDTVTKTANITGEVKYLSIKIAPQKWAADACKISRTRIDETIIGKIRNDYDLEKETRRIEGIYSKLTKIQR